MQVCDPQEKKRHPYHGRRADHRRRDGVLSAAE